MLHSLHLIPYAVCRPHTQIHAFSHTQTCVFGLLSLAYMHRAASLTCGDLCAEAIALATSFATVCARLLETSAAMRCSRSGSTLRAVASWCGCGHPGLAHASAASIAAPCMNRIFQLHVIRVRPLSGTHARRQILKHGSIVAVANQQYCCVHLQTADKASASFPATAQTLAGQDKHNTSMAGLTREALYSLPWRECNRTSVPRGP